MKKIYLIIAVLIFSAGVSFSQIQDDLFLESASKYNFEETVNRLSEQVTSKGWKVLVAHNLQESLKKNGFDVLPVKVLEICNPQHSAKLLSLDNERLYSSLMPCRISVYEKSDGKTYISRMNSAMLAGQIGGIVEEVMRTATDDMEEMIKMVVN